MSFLLKKKFLLLVFDWVRRVAGGLQQAQVEAPILFHVVFVAEGSSILLCVVGVEGCVAGESLADGECHVLRVETGKVASVGAAYFGEAGVL